MQWRKDRSRTIIPRWIYILYTILVVAAIAMTVLELARDSAARLGVGLIPMVLVGLIVVFVGLLIERKGLRRNVSLVNVFAPQVGIGKAHTDW